MPKVKSCIKQPEYKKPNFFIYFVLWCATMYARFKFNIYVDKAGIKAVRKIKSPVLVIGNHLSPLDFILMANMMYPKRLSFVVAANMYYDKRYAWAIRLLGRCIPKKQFEADFECVKSIKNMIDAGVSVALYPEGRCSIDGTGGKMNDSIVKLIKWLNVPVIAVRGKGFYLTRPKYASDMRRGRVEASVREIITPEESKTLPLAEIRKRILDILDYNDFKYQSDNNIAFKGKKGTAAGLENLLYKCPKCGAEFSHTAAGNIIKCGKCGNTVEIRENGELIPSEGSVAFGRIDLWYNYQKEELSKEIDAAENYTLSSFVTLSEADDREEGFRDIDKGVLSLSADGFSFAGEKVKDLQFYITSPPTLSVDIMSHIDFFRDNQIYRFYFRDKERPVKFDIATELIFEKFKANKKGV